MIISLQHHNQTYPQASNSLKPLSKPYQKKNKTQCRHHNLYNAATLHSHSSASPHIMNELPYMQHVSGRTTPCRNRSLSSFCLQQIVVWFSIQKCSQCKDDRKETCVLHLCVGVDRSESMHARVYHCSGTMEQRSC